jgi:hypothetical protein
MYLHLISTSASPNLQLCPTSAPPSSIPAPLQHISASILHNSIPAPVHLCMSALLYLCTCAPLHHLSISILLVRSLYLHLCNSAAPLQLLCT